MTIDDPKYHHRSDKCRTNNDLKGFHSNLNNSLLKMHSRVDDMIDFLKKQEIRQNKKRLLHSNEDLNNKISENENNLELQQQFQLKNQQQSPR
ncbi:unnamed protein product [Brachionus calyciflorus]|uniref:Uncharacterized protein n=1 Tax=Brachionus calyciflorus TaxID=104777 RepID=A0A814PEX4_9BILA|nr:unnamed protein product [Brachionus calyciflorus]